MTVIPKEMQGHNLVLREIYDFLMAEIEPELTSQRIPLLDEQYKDESSEQRRERGRRYTAAFTTFSERFSEVVRLWRIAVNAYRDEVVGEYKGRVKSEEQSTLDDIERSLGTS